MSDKMKAALFGLGLLLVAPFAGFVIFEYFGLVSDLLRSI